jgi:hypothetical protein
MKSRLIHATVSVVVFAGLSLGFLGLTWQPHVHASQEAEQEHEHGPEAKEPESTEHDHGGDELTGPRAWMNCGKPSASMRSRFSTAMNVVTKRASRRCRPRRRTACGELACPHGVPGRPAIDPDREVQLDPTRVA